MRSGVCTKSPPCELRQVELPRVELGWDGPSLGRKAVSFPKSGHVYLERAFWDGLPTLEGRKAILFHELGHLGGAECEPCADWYAGRMLRQSGATTDRDARRALLARLSNRDAFEAQQNLSKGFGADDPAPAGPSLQDLARAAAEEYGVEPAMLFAIIATESNWRQAATNLTGGDLARGGAYGLGQVTLKTAQALRADATPEKLQQADYNLSVAAQLISLNARTIGSGDFDIPAAYNSGKSYANAPASTRNTYVPTVLRHLATYRQQEGGPPVASAPPGDLGPVGGPIGDVDVKLAVGITVGVALLVALLA